MNKEKVFDSLNNAFGGYPDSWQYRGEELVEFFNRIPKIDNDHEMPPVSFLKFVKTQVRLDLTNYFSSVFSDKNLVSFVSIMPSMKEKAMLQSSLDVSNFEAESNAFSLEAAIDHPHLEISYLYRYLAIVKQQLLFLLDPEIQSMATEELRVNPYLFFSYGEEYKDFMPITWEDI